MFPEDYGMNGLAMKRGKKGGKKGKKHGKK
jgi:hypothetical protein